MGELANLNHGRAFGEDGGHERGQGRLAGNDPEVTVSVYQSEAKPTCTKIRNALGMKESKDSYSGLIWIDRERLRGGERAPARDKYKADHGVSYWKPAWAEAAYSAQIALCFVGDKALTRSDNIEWEQDIIDDGFPESNIIFIACDQTPSCYKFIEKMQAKGRPAFKRNEKDKAAAVDYAVKLARRYLK